MDLNTVLFVVIVGLMGLVLGVIITPTRKSTLVVPKPPETKINAVPERPAEKLSFPFITAMDDLNTNEKVRIKIHDRSLTQDSRIKLLMIDNEITKIGAYTLFFSLILLGLNFLIG